MPLAARSACALLLASLASSAAASPASLRGSGRACDDAPVESSGQRERRDRALSSVICVDQLIGMCNLTFQNTPCPDMSQVTSQNDCEGYAVAGGHAFRAIVAEDGPAGCFWDSFFDEIVHNRQGFGSWSIRFPYPVHAICRSNLPAPAPTPAPTSAPAPTPAPTPVSEAGYVLGDLGVDACPAGYFAISDAAVCESAAEHLELTYDASENTPDADSVCNFCTGCDLSIVRLSENHGDLAYWVCSPPSQVPFPGA